MNCLYSFRIKNKLKSHENVCKDHDYCDMIIPKEDNSVLKFNHAKIFEEPMLSMQTENCYLKKYPNTILIRKNFPQ